MNEAHDIEKKVFEYIALLEKTNDELTTTLKHCVRLLEQFTEVVPEPDEWEKMTNAFQELINVAEQAKEQKIYH